jgi:predicted cobalt transporter CbtA
MRPTPVRLLGLALSAAVLTLVMVGITHVHGISDPTGHHTPADFLLQLQTLVGVLLGCIFGFAHLRLPDPTGLPVTRWAAALRSAPSRRLCRAPPHRPI